MSEGNLSVAVESPAAGVSSDAPAVSTSDVDTSTAMAEATPPAPDVAAPPDTSAEQLTETSEQTAEIETPPVEQATEVERPVEAKEPTEAEAIIERLGGQERVQLIEELAQPGLDGKRGVELLKQLAPWNEQAIAEEIAWDYLENPDSQENIAQSLLGVPAEVLKKFAERYSEGYLTDADLEPQISDNISEADRAAIEAARQIEKRDKERETQRVQQQQLEQQQQVKVVYDEIFNSTLSPIKEIKEQAFKVTAEDAKSPQVKELKETAGVLYDFLALAFMDSDQGARRVAENLGQVLSKGVEYKDQARSMYAPDLSRRHQAAAAKALQTVNKLLTPALRGIQAEIKEKTKAPIEPAVMGSGMGGSNGKRPPMPEPGTPEFDAWATRGLSTVISTTNPKI